MRKRTTKTTCRAALLALNRVFRFKAMIVALTVMPLGLVSAASASGAAGDSGNSGANAGCLGLLSSHGYNGSNLGGQNVAILAPQKGSGGC
jgi:hypothetical protein